MSVYRSEPNRRTLLTLIKFNCKINNGIEKRRKQLIKAEKSGKDDETAETKKANNEIVFGDHLQLLIS